MTERMSEIAISPIPRTLWRALGSVDHPDQIDNVTRELGADPHLMNFHLATLVDMSRIGLGQCVYIPVQISSEEGGRKSLYHLGIEDEVLEGVFVTNNGIALSYVKRVSGRADRLAQTGDSYAIRVTSREGRAVFEGHGKLKVLDQSRGIGSLSIHSGPYKEGQEEDEPLYGSVWVGWSFVKVEW